MKKLKFFDAHIHINPDLYLRRYDIYTLGKELKSSGSACILKSHLCTTIQEARIAQQLGYDIYGSVVLNHLSGGICSDVIRSAIASNGNSKMIIYMPTLLKYQQAVKMKGLIHTVLDNVYYSEGILHNNKNKKELKEILAMAAYYNIPVATGHLNKKDIEYILEEATKKGTNIILSHPMHKMVGYSITELEELTKHKNIYMELTILMNILGQQTEDEIREVFSSIDNHKIIVSSDLGQIANCPVTKGFEKYVEMLRNNVSESVIERVICKNLFDIFS